MSTAIKTINAILYEDQGLVLMARMRNLSNQDITQLSLTSITCHVYDMDANATVVSSPSVVIADSVFDTLQTSSNDSRWTTDSTGYNFNFTVPASAFPEGGRHYYVKITFTPVSGDPFYLCADVYTQLLPGQ